jgi:hypothetical protein
LRGRHEIGDKQEQVSEDDGPLEIAMRQLDQAILAQQRQEELPLRESGFFNEQSFSERLYAERQKRRILASPKKINSVQQTLVHWTAAQDEQRNPLLSRDADGLARHLKSAISHMNSLLTNGRDDRRRRRPHSAEEDASLPNSDMTSVTGTAFETSAMRLAQALVANDGTDNKSPAFLMHVAVVKQGIKAVIAKLHGTLEEKVNSFSETLDLSKRMLLARQNHDMERLVDDPAAAASAVTNAIARFLDGTIATTTANGANDNGKDQTTALFDNLLTLLWTLPVDTVIGSFFWSFAGLGSFRDENRTPLQSSIFDIEWTMGMIGCLADKGILC